MSSRPGHGRHLRDEFTHPAESIPGMNRLAAIRRSDYRTDHLETQGQADGPAASRTAYRRGRTSGEGLPDTTDSPHRGGRIPRSASPVRHPPRAIVPECPQIGGELSSGFGCREVGSVSAERTASSKARPSIGSLGAASITWCRCR